MNDPVTDEFVLMPVPHGYRCCICKEFKPKERFTIDKKRPGDVGSMCRECKSLHIDKPYTKRTTEIRAIKFKMRRYGITEEEYRALYTHQSGVCAVCKRAETMVIKGSVCTLAVDHDHETGTVRGLLCRKCNQAIGLFKENVEWMEIAIAYLKSAG